MKPETKEHLARFAMNAGILMGAAALTALFQVLGEMDFGQFTPYVTAITAAGMKAIQIWVEPIKKVTK